ncbi:S9 family peptidase, partial [Streptomyces hygroscopicus]
MQQQTAATAPYGAWHSPVDAALVASHDGHPEYVGTVGEEVWWTAPRPAEGGRGAPGAGAGARPRGAGRGPPPAPGPPRDGGGGAPR